jgi:hypothetical protein
MLARSVKNGDYRAQRERRQPFVERQAIGGAHEFDVFSLGGISGIDHRGRTTPLRQEIILSLKEDSYRTIFTRRMCVSASK